MIHLYLKIVLEQLDAGIKNIRVSLKLRKMSNKMPFFYHVNPDEMLKILQNLTLKWLLSWVISQLKT